MKIEDIRDKLEKAIIAVPQLIKKTGPII